MKVKELIEYLQRCNPEAEVVAFDADAEKEILVRVTGAIQSNKEVQIKTESPL